MGIAIICIAVLVITIVIVLAILIYNQMLLLNEMNKRLLLLAKEAIEKERMTQEELQDALVALEQASNEQPVTTTAQTNGTFHDEDLDI
jgi:hypothetical protein